MDNDPRYIPDPEPKPKATYCPECSEFETEDDITHFASERLMRDFDVTIKMCDDCDNERFSYTVKKVGNKFKLINNEHFKN